MRNEISEVTAQDKLLRLTREELVQEICNSRLETIKYVNKFLEVEEKLMKLIPQEKWVQAHHHLIFFGRYHCTAKKPKCADCPVLDYCKFGKKYLKNE